MDTNSDLPICVECGEKGHFDCALRDPEVRTAAPAYAALLRLLGSDCDADE